MSEATPKQLSALEIKPQTLTITKTETGETHPLISVIVPVYNVAPYLRRCIDSLLAQTFRDFEIILVDDGSTDGSSAICDEYAKASNNGGIKVRAVHQPNAGVSSARNRGVDEARGVYISFIDADDWVEPSFLQAFADEIAKHKDVDLVVQGFWNHEKQPMTWDEVYYPTRHEVCLHMMEMEQRRLIGYVWNKIFRRTVITDNNIRFDPSVPIGEDYLFCLTCIGQCHSMAVTPHIGYHYFYPPGDHKDYPFAAWNKRLDGVDNVLCQQWGEMPGTVRQQLRAREFKMGLYVMRIAYHERLPRAERLAFLRKIKRWAAGNDEVRLSDYEPSFRILGWLVLYLPHALSDILLMTVRNLR